jgi:hypothetical protein
LTVELNQQEGILNSQAAFTLLGAIIVSWPASATIASESLSHLEQCTLTDSWDYQGGQFGVKNICDKSVSIQFMTQRNQKVKSTILKAGERFNTELSQTQVKSGWWVFTTCPVGYVSSVPFQVRYLNALTDGKYSCAKE